MNRSGRVTAAVAVALLAAGGATIATRPPPPPEIGTGAALAARPAAEPAPPAVEPSPDPTPRPKATPSIDPSRTRPATIPEEPQVARPTSLAIPGLDLRLAIRPGGLDQAGAMELPGTVREVSWYRFGPAPSERGATVIPHRRRQKMILDVRGFNA